MSTSKVIITEKPSVARDIAKVLKIKNQKDGFFEGNGYKITWAFGHLITLNAPEEYDEKYKKWDLETLPIIPEKFKKTVISNSGAQKQFRIIQSLLTNKDTSEVICATDAGREGELIFRYIYEHSHCSLPIKRLWISSQTDQAIKNGFETLKSGKDYEALYASAISRSEADWLIGMNATRAYTSKCSRGAGVMSIGRVQTPILKMIVDRYDENMNFKPEKFYEIIGKFQYQELAYSAKYIKKKETRFQDIKVVEEIVQSLKPHKKGHIHNVTHTKKKEQPPLLYDLTELQKDAHRKFKYSAENTLKILQALYEKHKLITYPRTSSRYLSSDLVPKLQERIQNITKLEDYSSIANQILEKKRKLSKRTVNDNKVTDHHAIIPTENIAKLDTLDSNEQQIYHLIIKRFLANFLEDCIKAQTEIITHVDTHVFKATGSVIISLGWQVVYKNQKEKDENEAPLLPNVTKGDTVDIIKITHEESQTKAPPLYNEASILAAMETAGKVIEDEELREAIKDCGLGTPATRASMIERLLSVQYIERKKNKLIPTAKGIQLISLIQSEELLSPEMTGEWEKKLNEIAKGNYQRSTYMSEIKAFTQSIVQKVIKTNLGIVGKNQNLIGKCPACNGSIIETKLGYSCNNWQQRGCKFIIWKTIAGKKISEKQAKELLKEGKTSIIKGFKNKKNESFDAALEIQSQTVKFAFPQSSIGTCPCENCNGNIIETPKAYSCSNWQQTGCSFVIWKLIAGKKIEKTTAQKILTTGKTDVLKGFKSRQGTSFEASLILKNGKVQFDFK